MVLFKLGFLSSFDNSLPTNPPNRERLFISVPTILKEASLSISEGVYVPLATHISTLDPVIANASSKSLKALLQEVPSVDPPAFSFT